MNCCRLLKNTEKYSGWMPLAEGIRWLGCPWMGCCEAELLPQTSMPCQGYSHADVIVPPSIVNKPPGSIIIFAAEGIRTLHLIVNDFPLFTLKFL
jgi:hypothetical protein